MPQHERRNHNCHFSGGAGKNGKHCHFQHSYRILITKKMGKTVTSNFHRSNKTSLSVRVRDNNITMLALLISVAAKAADVPKLMIRQV